MKIKKYSKYLLSLAMNDVNRSLDGTSKYVLTQEGFASQVNMGYIYLFYLKKTVKGKPLLFRFGVNIDGKFIGVYTTKQVVGLIKKNGFDISLIYLNNVISADFKCIGQILDAFPSSKIISMVHDYYLCCTNYSLCNNGKYCGARKLGDKACLVCEHYKESTKLEKEIWRFLNKYSDRMEFNAPSEFTKNVFLGFHPEIDPSRAHAVPNQNIVVKPDESVFVKNPKLKIGYIGYKNPLKGFDVFKEMTEKYKGIYDFLWFNSYDYSLPGAQTIKSGYDENHINGMVDYLSEAKVDVILLWATGPETFSYVAVESLSAKAYLLAYKDSGNVACIINGSKSGTVLSTKEELFALLDDYPSFEKRVLEYKKSLEGKSIRLEDNPGIIERAGSIAVDENYKIKGTGNLLHPLNVAAKLILLRRYRSKKTC